MAVFVILRLLLELYFLVVLVYLVIGLLKPAANRWTELLRSLVEPVLNPIRNFLYNKFPQLPSGINWAPIALLILIRVALMVINMIGGMIFPHM